MRNALRHGLNVAPPDQTGPRDELARRLAQGGGDDRASIRAAETQLHLQRVLAAKTDALQKACRAVQGRLAGETLDKQEIVAMALAECAAELLKLDRYERKARARRKKAFRSLLD